MADSKLWTAEELERLSPAERNEIIRSGIVTDLEDVPPAFLDRVRANVHDHISTSEPAAADGSISKRRLSITTASWHFSS